MLRKQQIISSLILLLASGSGFIYSLSQIKKTSLSIHPMFLVTVLFAFLLFLSIARLLTGIKIKKEEDVVNDISAPKKTIMTMGLIILYALAFDTLGYASSRFLIPIVRKR